MKLSSHQIEQFKQTGYLKIDEQVIDDNHLNVLRDHYDEQFTKRRNTEGEGMRNLAIVEDSDNHDDGESTDEMLQIMEMWRIDDEYKKLLYHKPMLDIVESLIGENIQLFHDQALYKPAYHGGEVFWHQDNAYWQCQPPNLVSIWLALDDADEENGCMNVIPGSYLEGLSSHGRAESEKGKLPALLQVDADVDRSVAVPVRAGHVMVHHCMTLHQTNRNHSSRDRRALAIHYMPTGTKNREGVVMKDNLLLRGSLV